MKRILLAVTIILSIFVLGCSTPAATTYGQIYSYTKKIEKKKVPMGGTLDIEVIKDFRMKDAYDEDIDALKEKVEKYISENTQLNDETKNNLRQLKVSAGLTKEQVELLLGKSDKVARLGSLSKYDATEMWVYKINKMRIYTVFIMPVFPVNESYCLYFTQDTLAGIERHHLKQSVEIGAGPGLEMKNK